MLKKKPKKKKKNLKEQRKTQRISWNEKRCADNVKILGEIREKNTQHDMINQWKYSGVRLAGKESGGQYL
jgi:hypothetical protein